MVHAPASAAGFLRQDIAWVKAAVGQDALVKVACIGLVAAKVYGRRPLPSMSRCGPPARRAASRPVCAATENSASSVDRKLLGTSTIGPHPARRAPAVAPRDPLGPAEAC